MHKLIKSIFALSMVLLPVATDAANCTVGCGVETFTTGPNLTNTGTATKPIVTTIPNVTFTNVNAQSVTGTQVTAGTFIANTIPSGKCLQTGSIGIIAGSSGQCVTGVSAGTNIVIGGTGDVPAIGTVTSPTFPGVVTAQSFVSTLSSGSALTGTTLKINLQAVSMGSTYTDNTPNGTNDIYGYQLGGQPIKKLFLGCIPYNPNDVNSSNYYSNPSVNGLNGGIVRVYDYSSTGKILIDSVFLANSPASGPFVNTAMKTLATPYTMPEGDVLTYTITPNGADNNFGWICSVYART